MKKSILAMCCILALLCFLSCDINALDGLLGKPKEKFLEENTNLKEELKFSKERQEVSKEQSSDVDNTGILNKGFSELGSEVKRNNTHANGNDNIIFNDGSSIELDMSFLENFDDRSKTIQWWSRSNEKTWENLHKISIQAEARVRKFYDIWIKAIEAYKVADKDLEQAISNLDKVQKDVKGVSDAGKNNIIFDAQKKLDAAIGVWRKAKEAEEKANEDRKVADDYFRKLDAKIKATFKVFEGFLETYDSDGPKIN